MKIKEIIETLKDGSEEERRNAAMLLGSDDSEKSLSLIISH